MTLQLLILRLLLCLLNKRSAQNKKIKAAHPINIEDRNKALGTWGNFIYIKIILDFLLRTKEAKFNLPKYKNGHTLDFLVGPSNFSLSRSYFASSDKERDGDISLNTCQIVWFIYYIIQ
jgi:hypothetical protein